MTTYVFVHGGFQGGWSFRALARLLRAAGHEVFTPTLTGLGERSHLSQLPINLDLHITDVVNTFLWEDISGVVLLGHSYGGMVITGVADCIPERVRALVYLDALVPKDGDNLFSLRPDLTEPFMALAALASGQYVAPFPASIAEANASYHALLNEKTTPHPYACFVQALRLSGAYQRIAQRAFIYAVGGKFGDIYEAYRDTPGADVFAIEQSGHSIMLDQPEAVAARLLTYA